MKDGKPEAVLTIIQGFLGAGKTTFSKELAEKEGAVRMNADEWCFEHISAGDLEADWDRCFSLAVETLWAKAVVLLAQKKSVVMDLGFWTISSREYARDVAKASGVAFRHYYLYAPDDILMERLERRQGEIAKRNCARFHEIKKMFQEPVPQEGAIPIDNF